MRPGDFSPGNLPAGSRSPTPVPRRFNEAGGFLPRKPVSPCPIPPGRMLASMRPGDFSPGNGGGTNRKFY